MLAKLEAVLGECWPEVLTVRTERKVRTITTEEKQEPKMSIKSTTIKDWKKHRKLQAPNSDWKPT